MSEPTPSSPSASNSSSHEPSDEQREHLPSQDAEEGVPRLKLTRLKIIKFRNVEPTELHFDDSANLLLGKNGTGKTTLLKLISACVRGDFSAWKELDFELEWEETLGQSTFVFHLSHQKSVDVTSSESAPSPPDNWLEVGGAEVSPFRTELCVTHTTPELSNRALVRLVEGELPTFEGIAPDDFYAKQATTRVLEIGRTRALHFWVSQVPAGPLATSARKPFHTVVNGTSNTIRFDESLETLRGVEQLYAKLEHKIFRVQNTAHQSVSVRSWGGGWDPYLPADLQKTLSKRLETILLEATPQRGNQPALWPSVVDVPIDELGMMGVFKAATGFSRAWASVALDWVSVAPDRAEVRFKELSFRFQVDEMILGHLDLSYGQKRLLSFLYYAACNDHVVIADELVNGLHHDWIETCLEAIGERQAFLTSQNPILLDYLPPRDAAQAERQFIRCRADEKDGKRVMIWENLTPDEATQFFDDYAAGVMQVSVLLRMRGLW